MEQHTYLKTHKLKAKTEDAQLRERAQAAKADRAAETLVKEGAPRMTVVALTKGAALQQHSVDGALSVPVLRGAVKFSISGRSASSSWATCWPSTSTSRTPLWR